MVLSCAMGNTFFSSLEESVKQRNSLLCVGIDPQEDIKSGDAYNSLVCFGERIIDQTAPYAACFKPNIAFYEAYGAEGGRALKDTIGLVPADIPVVLDAKRSDIGNTAKAYSKCIFDYYGANATTLNPYLGREAVLPFLEREDRGLFILCRTSNPGSDVFQNVTVSRNSLEPIPYFLMVAEEVSRWGSNVGLVVAGNLPRALQEVRKLLPDIWILAPGIGAQGGVIEEAVRAGVRSAGGGLLLNLSRSIARADSPADAARTIRDEINNAK